MKQQLGDVKCMGGQPVLFFNCWLDACVRGLARSIRPCQSARPAGWSGPGGERSRLFLPTTNQTPMCSLLQTKPPSGTT